VKYRRISTRPDRTTEPHSRIPDSIYSVLSAFTAYEVKLWIALKAREWRKDGTRRGFVKKSLNRIARDIGISRAAAQRAFRGLKGKGLAEWAGFGIRLLEPDFTTGFTTGFTTEELRRRRPSARPGVAVSKAVSDRSGRPATTVIPFPPNESGCGRSVLTIRHARNEPAHAVDTREVPDNNALNGGARVRKKLPRAPAEAQSQRKDGANMRDEKDSSDELDERPLSREEMHEALRRVHERANTSAAQAAAAREDEKAAERQKQSDRLEFLRKQAAELKKGESP